MKRKLIGLAVIVGILLIGVIAYHRFEVKTKSLLYGVFPVFAWTAVDQPVVFNHLRHRDTARLNCAFCHRHVDSYRSASIPTIDVCRACHSTDAVSKRPQALKVVEYVKANKEILWQRMYELPKFVVFPHWVHVQKNIDCSVCHGLTGTTERPIKMVDRNYMAWCMDCHTKRGASVDCYGCHSS